ncbi:MAG: phosphate ABC transporter permease PstA [Lachnospiraceae bacterium]
MNAKEKINGLTLKQRLIAYKRHPISFILYLLVTVSAIITVGVLIFIVAYILINGIPNLKPSLFAWEYTSDNVSMLPSIINTIFLTALTLLFTVPIGIGSAIYLAEYAKKDSRFVKVIRLMTETLSGIPSIIYGLFGLLFFVGSLQFGYSILAGAMTLAIMVLPLIIRTTEEALMSVSDTYREGSFGLGAGKLRTIFVIVLPAAMPGVLSGIILATGRIVGETAALIYTSGTVADVATSVFSSGRSLAVHMYSLSREGLNIDEAYATAVVLLIFVLLMNAISSRVAKKLAAPSK